MLARDLPGRPAVMCREGGQLLAFAVERSIGSRQPARVASSVLRFRTEKTSSALLQTGYCERVPVSSPARRVVGSLRLAAGLTLVVALTFQIIEKVSHNDMVPEEYFSYFTIQSSMIAAVALIVGGLTALRTPVDTVLYTTVRMSAFAYAVVTAIVYNVLLRGIPEGGFI